MNSNRKDPHESANISPIREPKCWSMSATVRMVRDDLLYSLATGGQTQMPRVV